MLLFCTGCMAQNAGREKAEKIYKDAYKHAYQKDFNKALKFCKDAKQKDSAYPEPYLLCAEIYRLTKKPDLQKKEYENLLRQDSLNASAISNLANIAYEEMRYADALILYKKLLRLISATEKQKNIAADRKARLTNIISIMNNPIPFTALNMGKNINSANNEFPPSFTVDEERMFFTRWKPLSEERKKLERLKFNQQPFDEDILFSTKKNGIWQPAADVPNINTLQNEGALSVAPDGSFLLFTACQREDGFGSCDIYISFNDNGKWIAPQNIGAPLNTENFEGQPSISYDGKTIYFVSNRPGGKGNLDIWKITRDDDWKFSAPENLGSNINTSGKEQSPYIHTDDQTLYFSSNQLPGMGEGDIFIARKNKNGEWNDVKNMGYPLNTTEEETGLVVDRKGEYAYFTSGKGNGGMGGTDIYYFKLTDDKKPSPVTYLKGKVYDSLDKQTLKSEIEITDLSNGSIFIKTPTLQNGKFLLPLTTGKDYLINIRAKGYLFYSDNIPLKNYRDTTPYLHDAPLLKISPGKKIILRNIFFKTDSFALEKKSETELNYILDFLKNNPNVKVEISGHTDNSGNATYNKILSENRAKSLSNYIIEKGMINPNRIRFMGYGDAQPLAPNISESGKAKNRRTELKIIE